MARQNSIEAKLTSRIDSDHSDIEAAELCCKQFDEVICRSFAGCVAGQVDIRCIVHTGTRACHDDRATTVVFT